MQGYPKYYDEALDEMRNKRRARRIRETLEQYQDERLLTQKIHTYCGKNEAMFIRYLEDWEGTNDYK